MDARRCAGLLSLAATYHVGAWMAGAQNPHFIPATPRRRVESVADRLSIPRRACEQERERRELARLLGEMIEVAGQLFWRHGISDGGRRWPGGSGSTTRACGCGLRF
jgi:hypothetical protein